MHTDGADTVLLAFQRPPPPCGEGLLLYVKSEACLSNELYTSDVAAVCSPIRAAR